MAPLASCTLALSASAIAAGTFAPTYPPLPVRPQPVFDLPQGVYNIRNVKSGKYLNVLGGSLDEGANIQLWNNPQSPHSQWRISHVFEYGRLSLPTETVIQGPVNQLGIPAVYHIKNVHSGKSLTAFGTNDMANVEQSSDASMPGQWMIQFVGDRVVGLQNANSAKWLNVQGGGVTDGANVCQFHSNLQNDSWWVLESPTCLPEGSDCSADDNQCCMDGSDFKQMACHYGHDSGPWCYDLGKCSTGMCDFQTCCDGWTCVNLGPVNQCQKKNNTGVIAV
ncbi:unnamed protein product [Prorocentrum cordatum]|uniref:Ricin B lectin domain-containing protein n=1 Tax=Prorocentrum cordatum TaxID=2364126 RepID=A0ABN9T6N5_9DINO|nr:unnamed protein product [Polarella glacialis]